MKTVESELFRSFGPAYMTGYNYILGTTTNDSADAGYFGEVLSSSVAQSGAVALATTVTSDIFSLDLTAGDWDVFGQVGFTGGGTTTILDYGISLTSATLPANDVLAVPTGGEIRGSSTQNIVAADVTFAIYSRVSVASSTTHFLVANATFAVGAVSAYGSIFARRSR